jgi:PAS domain S-box-containing protein
MEGSNELKILFVEDMPADYEIALHELEKNSINFMHMRVENSEDFENALKEFSPDIVISDYSMPQFNVMEALKISKEYDKLLPFIILTGTLNEETAVGCIKAGANDYVLKGHMGRLSYAVKEAAKYNETMRKKLKAESALFESESRYRSMFENNYAVMLLVDSADASIIDSNPAASDYYGYSHSELISKNLSEISLQDKKTLMERLNLSESGNKNYYSSKHKLVSGAERDVEVFLSPVIFKGRMLVHTIVYDVTERNRAFAELESSLNEKKDLIKEIYHRTKNNMQVIISMLELQAIVLDDDKIQELFQNMEYRISAMALVHEKLFQGKNLSMINLKDYLTELVDNIMTGYGIKKDQVIIKHQMDEVDLLIDTAIPCGLVVNELVSNAAKHAFFKGTEGILEIVLSREEDGTIKIVISDNGPGIKSEEMNSPGSMGLQIVRNIAEYQMKGTIKYSPDHGTKWELIFTDNMYEQRV